MKITNLALSAFAVLPTAMNVNAEQNMGDYLRGAISPDAKKAAVGVVKDDIRSQDLNEVCFLKA